MEIFSFIVLILLPLVGYSIGAVGKAGKSLLMAGELSKRKKQEYTKEFASRG